MAIFVVLCVLALFYFLFTLWERFTNMKLYIFGEKLPGPTAYPIVGNLLDLVNSNADTLMATRKISEDGLTRVWIGEMLTVLLADPKYIQIVYNHKGALAKPQLYEPLELILSKRSVVNLAGEEWKKSRKIATSALHAISMSTWASVIERETDKIMEKIMNHSGKGHFSIGPHLHDAGSAITVRILFNEDLSEKMAEVITSVNEMADITALKTISPLHYFNFIFTRTAIGRKFDALNCEFDAHIKTTVMKKQEDFEGMKRRGEKHPDAAIFHIMNDSPGQTVNDLTTHMKTIIVAAVDSSADAVGFALMMVGLHQDIQEKLRNEDLEIQRQYETTELNPTIISKYHYLDMVVKETLRLYPSFPVSGRYCTEDIDLGDYVLPEGTNLLISHFWGSRRSQVFKDPLSFNPERFDPYSPEKLHPYAYNAFGAGARACIGSKFAMFAIKLQLTKILRAFKIFSKYNSSEEVEKNLTADIFLREKNDFPVMIEIRGHQ